MTQSKMPDEIWIDYADYQDPERGLVAYEEDMPVCTVKYTRTDLHTALEQKVSGLVEVLERVANGYGTDADIAKQALAESRQGDGE